jgi:hypothetical protein
MEGYNGWANWDTWEVNNIISNTEVLYRMAINSKTTNAMKQAFIARLTFGDTTCNADLDQVNWKEIFKNIKGDE